MYGLGSYGGIRDRDGTPVGTVIQAYAGKYEEADPAWVHVTLFDEERSVLVPYAGSAHRVDDEERMLTQTEGQRRPEPPEQRLGFSVDEIRSAPTFNDNRAPDPDETQLVLRHYFPALPATEAPPPLLANAELMARTVAALDHLPYLRTSGPSFCVLRDDRGYVAAYRPVRSSYHKIIDHPFGGHSTQLVEFAGSIGLHVAKGFTEVWALSDDSLYELREASFAYGTALTDLILDSNKPGKTTFFDLVDPPVAGQLSEILNCLTTGTVVLGRGVHGPAYASILLAGLRSPLERMVLNNAVVELPLVNASDITCSRDAVLVLDPSEIPDPSDLLEEPVEHVLLVFDSKHRRIELGAQISLRERGTALGDDHPEVRLDFWDPAAETLLKNQRTFELWSGHIIGGGKFVEADG